MRRLALLCVAAAAVVGFGSSAGAGCQAIQACVAVPAGTATPAPREPLLAVAYPGPNTGNKPAILARLDSLSLRPVSRTVEVGEYHRAWSLSPDGSHLALGISSPGSVSRPGRIGIQIADLEAMEVVQEVHTGVAAVALGWLAPRLLVAALQRGGTVLVDPLTGRILRRWLGFSFPDLSAPTRDGLVMLLPKLRKAGPVCCVPLAWVAGPPRLAVVDAQSRLRSVTLERIQLGVRSRDGTSYYYRDRAGLAVDPTRERAYVFAADAPVAEVDLRTMRVSYHRLQPLFLRRPSREAPLERRRDALWLGDGHVAVSGSDRVAGRDGKDGFVAAGAMLVDTATWRWRTLDRRASGAAFAAGRLLVYGPAGWYSAAGVGMRAYTLGGRRLFHLFKGKRVFDVNVAAGRAYVRIPSAVSVVDVSSGKALGKIVPPVDLVDVIAGPS